MSPLRVLFVIFSLCLIHQAFGQPTPSNTQTITQTMSQTITQTMSQTITQTMSNTITQTMSNTITQTTSNTISQTITQTITQTISQTITQTISQTITQTHTQTISSSVTTSFSMTISGTQSKLCVCGDRVVCGSEQCDGGQCCSTACALRPVGTRCGVRQGACFRRPSCTADGTCRRNVPKRANAPCVENGASGTCNSNNRCITSGVSPSRAAASKSRVAASKSRKAVSPSKKAASKSKKAVSPSKKAASKSKKAVSPSKKAASKSKKAVSPSKKAASKSKKAVSKSKAVKAVSPSKKAVSKSKAVKAVSKSKAVKAVSKSKAAASKSKAVKSTTKLNARYKLAASGSLLKGKLNLKNKGVNTATNVVATITIPSANKFSKFKQNSASICTATSTSTTIVCTLSTLGVEKASIISFVLTGVRQAETAYTVRVVAGNAATVSATAIFP